MHETHAPRRKLRVLWIIVALILLRAGWIAYQQFGSGPPIIISKETTFIFEPLDEDGFPDYLEFIRQKKRRGVTLENNAVVLILQAVSPQKISLKDRQDFFSEFGVKSQAKLSKPFLPLDKETEKLFVKAHYQPWQSQQGPQLASWLESNLSALDIAVEASERERFYAPLISEPTGTANEAPLMSMLLQTEVCTTELANALCIRAMWHLGEGRHPSAKKDLLAAFKLARHVANEGSLVCSSQLSFQCNEYVNRALCAVLTDTALTRDEAQAIQRELQEITPWTSVAKALKTFERFSILDAIMNMKHHGIDSLDGQDSWSWIDFVQVDYNLALRDANDWFDKLDEQANLKNRSARKEASDQIDAELKKVSFRAIQEKESKQAKLDLRRRSQVISDILICLLLPATEAVLDGQDRANVELDLTRLAAALAVYRAEQKEYPEQLADLVPTVLPKLPIDLYSGKSFLYERKDDGGYLLYSVFENGSDDGGDSQGGEVIDGEWLKQGTSEQPEDFDSSETDLVIRVPVPAFEFPEPPSQENFGYGYGGGYEGE